MCPSASSRKECKQDLLDPDSAWILFKYTAAGTCMSCYEDLLPNALHGKNCNYARCNNARAYPRGSAFSVALYASVIGDWDNRQRQHRAPAGSIKTTASDLACSEKPGTQRWSELHQTCRAVLTSSPSRHNNNFTRKWKPWTCRHAVVSD